MGVRGLMSWLKPYAKFVSWKQLLEEYPKKRIAIDVSYYMYKWQANSERLLNFLKEFETAGHRVILIFDGRAADGKQWEAQRRRAVREEEQKTAAALQAELEKNQDLTDEQKFVIKKSMNEHQKRGWGLTKEIRHTTKRILYEKYVPMLKGTTEADGLLASLSCRGDIDYVISGDMDVFAMGTKLLLMPLKDGKQFLLFDREKILNHLSLTDYQFRSMCAMCFTEMRQEQEYMDIRQAYQGLQVFQSFETLKRKHPEWLKVWPDDSHIFYADMYNLDKWLREDHKPYYEAFKHGQKMPYENENYEPLSP